MKHDRDIIEKINILLNNENEKRHSLIPFSEYYRNWLLEYKHYVAENTYDSYRTIANTHILPYFDRTNIYLQSIRSFHLQEYYDFKIRNGLSPNTVHHHHVNLHTALKAATRKQLIDFNPATTIEFPKHQTYSGNFYTLSEIDDCIAAFAGDELETCVWLAIVFGLRRSEILGLKWLNVILKDKLFIITDTVVSSYDSEKKETKIISKNKTKNESSHRILPLTNFMYTHLKKLWLAQNKPCKSAHVILNKYGKPMHPDYLTRKFKERLEDCGLRVIRFHDLRHSCATMLHRMGYDMQDIQKWLGHSTIGTTAKYYSHYDLNDKIVVSRGLDNVFGYESNYLKERYNIQQIKEIKKSIN